MYQLKIDKASLEKYDFKTMKILGFKTLQDLNLPDNYFGGRVSRIVSLQQDDNLIIVDEFNNVIGILTQEQKEKHSCDKCDKEFDTALKLGAHKRFCKQEVKNNDV